MRRKSGKRHVKRRIAELRVTLPGSSVSDELTSITSPDTGEYTSLAALTDSTTPKFSDFFTWDPNSGSSTYTTSPSSAGPVRDVAARSVRRPQGMRTRAPECERARISPDCAKSEIPTVATFPSILAHSCEGRYLQSPATACTGLGASSPAPGAALEKAEHRMTSLVINHASRLWGGDL